MELHDLVLGHVPLGVALISNRTIRWANQKFADFLDRPLGELINQPTRGLYLTQGMYEAVNECYKLMAKGLKAETVMEYQRPDGSRHWLWMVGKSLSPDDAGGNSVWTIEDITKTREMETLLRGSQLLESIGRLAAGVAHEINTPVQYVSDNVRFVREAFEDLEQVFQSHKLLKDRVLAGKHAVEEAKSAEEAERKADLNFILGNTAAALAQASQGLDRIAGIVRSMKEFSHPDQKEMAPTDLNRSIQATLIVSRNEYKYVAEVETDLCDLPPVVCHAGEINEVLLNILVNAAHAIGDRVKGTDTKGTIRIHSFLEGDVAVIDISDTGGGIPEKIRSRVFEPFFTTKEVGRGTGQGLSISRAIIVDKHRGSLDFDVEQGVGTTFHIRIPVKASPPAEGKREIP